jgi:hypothetical protein
MLEALLKALIGLFGDRLPALLAKTPAKRSLRRISKHTWELQGTINGIRDCLVQMQKDSSASVELGRHLFRAELLVSAIRGDLQDIAPALAIYDEDVLTFLDAMAAHEAEVVAFLNDPVNQEGLSKPDAIAKLEDVKALAEKASATLGAFVQRAYTFQEFVE